MIIKLRKRSSKHVEVLQAIHRNSSPRKGMRLRTGLITLRIKSLRAEHVGGLRRITGCGEGQQPLNKRSYTVSAEDPMTSRLKRI